MLHQFAPLCSFNHFNRPHGPMAWARAWMSEACLSHLRASTFCHVSQVSSFAACNHWLPHRNLAESDADASPPLTTLRSPYDLSKATAEQFILQKHSKVMRTVSVRIGGVPWRESTYILPNWYRARKWKGNGSNRPKVCYKRVHLHVYCTQDVSPTVSIMGL